MECPHTLSHFIANAPLEGDYYRQIRADIEECDRLGKPISAEVIDRDALLDLEAQGSAWRSRIESFQRTLEAFAPADKLLDHASGLDISDDLEGEYLKLEALIQPFCQNVSKYKYRISRIIRLRLYAHCLVLSQRSPACELMSNLCIRDSYLPDDPSIGVEDGAVDKGTLFKHLTDLRRVDSVVKEWMFTAKIVKSAIAIKTVGWNIDHEKLFNVIGRWHSERQTSEQTKEMQEALEEAMKQIEEAVKQKGEAVKQFEEAMKQNEEDMKQNEEAMKQFDELIITLRQAWQNLLGKLDDATIRKDDLEEALDQATKQKEENHETYENAAKQARESLEQAAKQVQELKAQMEDPYLKAGMLLIHSVIIAWLVFEICLLFRQ